VSRRPTNRTARRPVYLTRLEDRTAPAVAIWDGGGADNKWTTPANWAGDVAPQPGDDLVFPAGVRIRTNVNDFPADTAFHSIAVNGASPRQNEAGYQISGSAVTVTAGITADFAFGFYPLNSTSTLSLDVSGTGGVTKNGTGRLVLAGHNSYTGVTTVNAGVLEVQTDTALGATGTGNETTVVDGATLDLNNVNQLVGGLPPLTIAEPIAFAGDGVFERSSILGAISGDYGPLLTGPLTLTGNGRIAGFLTILSGVGETGGPRDLFLSGPTIASTAVNTHTGTTTVSPVQYDGQGPGPVVVDGVLVGAGTINGPVRGSIGGSVRGGTGGFQASIPLVPGTLTVGDLDLSQGTMKVVIGAQGASEIAVRGTVRLGGNLDASLLAAQPSDPTPFRSGSATTSSSSATTVPTRWRAPSRDCRREDWSRTFGRFLCGSAITAATATTSYWRRCRPRRLPSGPVQGACRRLMSMTRTAP
jgi:autotransporter-associated beta strand protein